MKKEPVPPSTRIIKRYQNRKLYDTETSCYVTLEDISQMVKEGDEVKVIDNRNGTDLTTVTLTQIIFEEEKKNKSLLPLSTLKNIIQTGGESVVDFFQKSLDSGVSSITNVKDEAGKVLEKLKDEFEEGGSFLKDFLQRANKNIDDIQQKVEERVKHPFGGGTQMKTPKLKDELRALRKKLATMERKLKDNK